MTDSVKTIILAGRVIGFTPPTQGQIEVMARIGKSLQRGTDDEPMDFWITQLDRIGTLLESLIAEGDREVVDMLYLTGKISHTDLLTAVMDKVKADKPVEVKDAKANKARVQRK